MTSVSLPQKASSVLLGSLRTSGGQDARTVRLLRLGVGVIGSGLPLTLIAGNWMTGSEVIVPSSMSGSYYTNARNLFVGALCALAVFLIGYRHTARQDRCTSIAGVCALLVAFDPTAPPLPRTEPAWISTIHAVAAVALISTLGMFCWIVFADHTQSGRETAGSVADHLRAWMTRALDTVRQSSRNRVYVACGVLVFASGGLALYTGLWPTSWSAGWPSCYLFEAVAVFAFGIAWMAAGVQGIRQQQTD